ncbi:retropepsin-like aspartic protease family protein [Parerythrobacter aestuarii]|uniref:retropepsin-like aspartic protease family protein n=1 Tax=Parerythrobacter aestuarii TaxID=3020909 RepID=UPI002DD6293A|nr:retroviral-like aspartic protease family protein [Parerythrobacter aestuarii]
MDLPPMRAYSGRVEQDAMFAEWFDRAVALVASVPKSSLLMLALAAMLASWIGGTMLRRGVPLGGLVRSLSTVALVGVLVTVVMQVARIDPRFDVAVAELGMPGQVVEGGETRIPLADDGHYWLRAKINGTEAAFLVDTGATLTAISQETAERAGIEPRAVTGCRCR